LIASAQDCCEISSKAALSRAGACLRANASPILKGKQSLGAKSREGGAMGRLAAIALVAAGMAATTGARAEIQFCNKFPQKVFVAIAYQQDDQSWLSRGWLEVDTGDCAEFDSALHPSVIYYRGESVPYRNASGVSVTRVWSTTGRQFAIWEKDNFNYWNAQEKVLNSTLVDFSLLSDGLALDASVTVTFEQDGIHTTTSVQAPHSHTSN
jgi:hypothetical protein